MKQLHNSFGVSDYVMVQLTFEPNTFPNLELEDKILSEADKYIKSRKLTMAGVVHFDTTPQNLDYRLSAFSNRKKPVKNSNNTYTELNGWHSTDEQVFYRIFVDKRSALEFMKFNLECGAKKVRIINKMDCGVVQGVPASIPFPTIDRVRQFLWNQDENIN